MLYRDGLATVKFNAIEQQGNRLSALEFESQKHWSGTYETIAGFRLQHDVLRERLRLCELEADSSRRVGLVSSHRLSQHEGHLNDFKATHADELGALQAALTHQISS